MVSEVATMQENWQESWKEGVAGWHDGEGRPYSGEVTTQFCHSSVY